MGKTTTRCKPNKGQKPRILIITVFVRMCSENHLRTYVKTTHVPSSFCILTLTTLFPTVYQKVLPT